MIIKQHTDTHVLWFSSVILTTHFIHRNPHARVSHSRIICYPNIKLIYTTTNYYTNYSHHHLSVHPSVKLYAHSHTYTITIWYIILANYSCFCSHMFVSSGAHLHACVFVYVAEWWIIFYTYIKLEWATIYCICLESNSSEPELRFDAVEHIFNNKLDDKQYMVYSILCSLHHPGYGGGSHCVIVDNSDMMRVDYI